MFISVFDVCIIINVSQCHIVYSSFSYRCVCGNSDGCVRACFLSLRIDSFDRVTLMCRFQKNRIICESLITIVTEEERGAAEKESRSPLNAKWTIRRHVIALLFNDFSAFGEYILCIAFIFKQCLDLILKLFAGGKISKMSR